MRKSLIPTPVMDKNGRLTTVHKKPASASLGTDNLVGVPPVAYTAPAPVRESLTAAEVEEFLSAAGLTGTSRKTPGYVLDTEGAFRSLPGETQAILKRLHDDDVLSYDAIMETMTFFMDEYPGFGWIDGTPSRIAEPLLQSSSVIMGRAVSQNPELLGRFGQYGLDVLSREVVLGCMEWATEAGVRMDVSSAEGLDTLTGMFLFVMDAESDLLRQSSYADERGRGHRSLLIKSDTVARFVIENPDLARDAAAFMSERGLGGSEADVQFMMDHFTETAEALSISSGRL